MILCSFSKNGTIGALAFFQKGTIGECRIVSHVLGFPYLFCKGESMGESPRKPYRLPFGNNEKRPAQYSLKMNLTVKSQLGAKKTESNIIRSTFFHKSKSVIFSRLFDQGPYPSMRFEGSSSACILPGIPRWPFRIAPMDSLQ